MRPRLGGIFEPGERFSLIVVWEPPQPKKGEVQNQQRHYGEAGPVDPIQNPKCHCITGARTNSVKQSADITEQGIKGS
jgi:hypothetical protein